MVSDGHFSTFSCTPLIKALLYKCAHNFISKHSFSNHLLETPTQQDIQALAMFSVFAFILKGKPIAFTLTENVGGRKLS